MPLHSPEVTIIIPRFKREKSHWWTLKSVLEQEGLYFNLIVGCDSEVLGSVIKYINEYRFSVDSNKISVIELVDDKEALADEAYMAELKSRSETECSLVVDAGMMLNSSEAVYYCYTSEKPDWEAVQKKLSPYIVPYVVTSAVTSAIKSTVSPAPIPEDVKKKVVNIRDELAKHAKLDNIMYNLIWVVFFLLMYAYLHTFSNGFMQVLAVLAAITAIAFILLLIARFVSNIVIRVYDQILINRRLRRGK